MGKKLRMNRGLEDLFGDNILTTENPPEVSDNNGTTYVRLSLLEPNKSQPRDVFDDEALNELADSIRENGVLQPILVRPLDNGGYQIVAGERRWRASRIAGLTEVPVFIKELDDKQTMQIALIENIQRQDLSPVEEAAAYQNLMDSYNMTQQEVAKAVGKSRSAVANSLRILSLCDDVKKMVNDGLLTAGHAKVLAGLEEADQIELAAQVEEMNLSVRQLEAMAAEINKPKSPYNKEEMDKIRENSFKKERPFLKEFEISVNTHSNVKVKAKDDKQGGAKLTFNVGKDIDIQSLLSKLADVLTQY